MASTYSPKDLNDAIIAKDITQVKIILDAKPELLDSIYISFYPIHQSIYEDSIEILDELLRRGANPNVIALNGSNASPLLLYIIMNDENLDKCSKININIISSLIGSGANINLKSHDGKTILHYANMYGCTDLISFLISNGGDESIRDNYYKNPEQLFVPNISSLQQLRIYLNVNIRILDHEIAIINRHNRRQTPSNRIRNDELIGRIRELEEILNELRRMSPEEGQTTLDRLRDVRRLRGGRKSIKKRKSRKGRK